MSLSAVGASPSGSASGLDLFPDDGPGSALTGLLRHNASDQRGIAPYMLVDRWGVVRGYVSAKPGLELEPYLGQQITLKGTMHRLPAGDMPLLAAETVGSGGKSVAVANYTTGPAFSGSSAVRQVEHQDPLPTPKAEPPWKPAPAVANYTPASAPGGWSAARQVEQQEPVPAPKAEPPLKPAADAARPLEPLAAPPQPSMFPQRPMAFPPPSDFGGEPMTGDPYLAEPGYGPAYGPECGPCGPGCGPCGPDCGPGGPGCGEWCGPTMCRRSPGLWVDADTLLWWMRGMHVPPLVTTGPGPTSGGTPTAADSGGPGEPLTQIVFGDTDINDRLRAGGRIQFGLWLDCCQRVALEGEYFALGQDGTHFRMWSDGTPVLSRPFYDMSSGVPVPAIESIASPRFAADSIDGAVSVDALTRFQGAGARLRFSLCRADACWSDPCWSGQTFHDSYRSYWTLGYRFLRLDDRLGITEQLTSTVTGGQGAFLIQDDFGTTNQFHGAELGLQFEWQRNRWSLEFAPRIALGNTHESGLVDGFTRTTDPTTGVQTFAQPPDQGGLLTKSTNIGVHSRDAFGVVPELTLKLGYQVTPHTRATLGYDFLAWSDVLRAGDQIDLRTTAPGTAPTTANPAFPFLGTAFWAQGLDLGLEFHW
jgi:hypothetical protein